MSSKLSLTTLEGTDMLLEYQTKTEVKTAYVTQAPVKEVCLILLRTTGNLLTCA